VNAHALQCRVTTEDPENNFVPDYGRVTAYRSPAGFGIRLDAGTAYAGAIITRFYDSLLVKVTAWSPTPEETIARMHRALWEFRIRGVVTNLRFLDQLIMHPRFASADYTTSSSIRRRNCSNSAQARPRDAAAELHRRCDRQRQSRK
jgi:pyruvate carboxylase